MSQPKVSDLISDVIDPAHIREIIENHIFDDSDDEYSTMIDSELATVEIIRYLRSQGVAI